MAIAGYEILDSLWELAMKWAFVALVLWWAASWAMADEIHDLFTQQRVQKVAAERAAARAARRRSHRPTKTATAKKDEPQSDNPVSSKTEHGITEIGSERPVGWHTGPAYTLVAKSDGAFRFEGRENVAHIGKWTGTVDRKRFDELANFVRDAGYTSFQDMYFNDASDITPLYTMIVQDGKRHVVQDWFTGPEKLREIERRIDALLDGAQWNEQPAEPEAESD
ncbi:MAG TPA: DUF6438 domain-containing protein [Pirellulales bacterium]|nr:DUF6438 domain-containing protein [Pirellulales bacterium]